MTKLEIAALLEELEILITRMAHHRAGGAVKDASRVKRIKKLLAALGTSPAAG